MGIKASRILDTFTSNDRKEFKSKYSLGKTLGSGSYGKIVEATQVSTFRTVAVKMIKRKNVETIMKVQNRKIPAEAVFLNALDHHNIISLVDIYEFKNKFALVLERPLASMDIHEFVSKYGPQNNAVASSIGKQLLSACNYMDQNLIFHRDIKSENILVNVYNYQLKIADFGSATYANQDVYYGTYGTPAFSPPQWIDNTGYQPEPTTIWSCGVVLFEVMTEALPFIEEDHVKRATIFFPDLVSHSARDLIRKMLKREEQDRVTFVEALEHPFLSAFGEVVNDRILDESTYSKCSGYTIYENMTSDSEYPLSRI